MYHIASAHVLNKVRLNVSDYFDNPKISQMPNNKSANAPMTWDTNYLNNEALSIYSQYSTYLISIRSIV